MYRAMRILFAMMVLALIPLNIAYAHIRACDVNDGPIGLIEKFHARDKGFPVALATDKDIFVVVYASAASSDFYVLARPSIDPKQLATRLDTAVHDTPLAEEPVLYMHDQRFTWADAYVEHRRLWSRDARMRHPVGPVVSKLLVAGFKPHILLCTLKFDTASHLPNLHPFIGRRWRVSKVSPNQTGLDFTLQSHFSLWEFLQGIFLILGVPLIGIVGMLALIYYARAKRTTPEGRRALFTGAYFWLMMACFAGIAMLISRNLQSAWRYRLDDMWISHDFSFLWPIIVLFEPMIFIGISKLVAKLVFPGSDPASSPTKRHRWLVRILSFLAFVAALAVIDHFRHSMPKDALLAQRPGFILVFLPLVLKGTYDRLIRSIGRLSGPRAPDIELSNRLSRFALQLGLKLDGVYLVDAPNKGASVARYVNQALLVRRELVEKLSPEELDFLAVHELAHAARHDRARSIGMTCFAAIVFLVPLFLFITQSPDLSPWNWQLWGIALGSILLTIDSMLPKGRETDADYQALSLTRDLESATQAVAKEFGLDPMDCDINEADLGYVEYRAVCHDEAASRLLWLGRSAVKLGLKSGEGMVRAEQDHALTARAQDLALRMGTRVSQVYIGTPPKGVSVFNARANLGGVIGVSRALVDGLNSEELDFVLAHELAHMKCRHSIRKLIPLGAGLVLMLSGLTIVFISMFGYPTGNGIKVYPMQGIMLCTVLIIAFLLANIAWFSRRDELQADRIALRTTRNYAAAVSLMRKLSASNKVDIPEELEQYRSHPEESLRVKSLYKEAKRLGIATGGLEEPVP